VTNVTEPSVFVVCLNDRDADGTDVSWIWDVDFEQIAEMGDRLDGLYLSGCPGRGYGPALQVRWGAGGKDEGHQGLRDPHAHLHGTG